MNISLKDTIFYTGILVPMTIIAPISLSVIKYKSFSKEIKIFTYYLLLSGITNLVVKVIAERGINNMPLVHIYSVLEFGFICAMYQILLAGTRISRFLWVLFLSFLSLAILNAVFFQSIFTFNSYTKPIEAFLVIWLAINYMLKHMEDYDTIIENKKVLLYINSGFLLYFSGSFILFTIFNIFATHNVKIAYAIVDAHATLLLLMYVIFTIALWKFKM